MTDIERWFEHAQYHRHQEGRHRWVLAIIANKVVGLRNGLTKQFALSLSLTASDAVEHWAKAHGLYRRIRFKSVHAAHKFRDEFTVSHFYAMSELESKHDLSMSQVIGYFRILLDYKERGESWSLVALKNEVEADYPTGRAVSWGWHWSRIDKHAIALLSFGKEPPVLVQAFARMYNGLKNKVK